MPWSDPVEMIRGLSIHGLIPALAGALIWIAVLTRALRLRRRDLPARSLTIAAVLGTILFLPSIGWIQVPLQHAVSEWANASFATANVLILSLPVIMLSGLVQEPTKWLGALAAGRSSRVTADRRRTATVFGVCGLAYGWIEAWLILSFVHTLQAPMIPAVLERLLAIGFHATITAIAGWYLVSGAGAGFLALTTASLYHGAVNSLTVLPVMGVPVPATSGILVVTMLIPPAVLVGIMGRELRICERRR